MIVHNLERHGRLAGAGRHCQEKAALPAEDRLDGAVDGDLLVIPRRLATDSVVRGEQMFHLRGSRDLAPGPIPLPEIFGFGEIRDARFRAVEVVNLDDVLPVGGIGEFQAQHFGVGPCLLDAVGGGLVAGLGFDHGERKVAGVAQELVHPLRGFADEALADGDDSTVGDGALLSDRTGVVVPASSLKFGDYEFSTSIGFVVAHCLPFRAVAEVVRFVSLLVSSARNFAKGLMSPPTLALSSAVM